MDSMRPGSDAAREISPARTDFDHRIVLTDACQSHHFVEKISVLQKVL
jgi:hypothetical protein